MTFAKFNPKAEITHTVHVSKTLGNYNIIIGRDLLYELGINIKFSTKTVRWNNVEINMKNTYVYKRRFVPRGRRTVRIRQNRSHRKNIRCKIPTGQSKGINGQRTTFNHQSTTTVIQLFK